MAGGDGRFFDMSGRRLVKAAGLWCGSWRRPGNLSRSDWLTAGSWQLVFSLTTFQTTREDSLCIQLPAFNFANSYDYKNRSQRCPNTR